MKFTYRHRFAADLATVSAALGDRGFEKARADAMGSSTADLDVDPRDDGTLMVSVRATVPTDSIPSELRGFVGRELSIGYTEAWEPLTDADRIATFAADILGAPGHVAGAIGLTADGGHTDLLATGDVIANVPLVGPMIERAVNTAVERAFAAQFAAADAWLAE